MHKNFIRDSRLITSLMETQWKSNDDTRNIVRIENDETLNQARNIVFRIILSWRIITDNLWYQHLDTKRLQFFCDYLAIKEAISLDVTLFAND